MEGVCLCVWGGGGVTGHKLLLLLFKRCKGNNLARIVADALRFMYGLARKQSFPFVLGRSNLTLWERVFVIIIAVVAAEL